MRPTALLAGLALVLAAPALASAPSAKKAEGTIYLEGAAMTYDLFEKSVMHVDLPQCPAEFDPEKVFCRMTIAADHVNVFVFARDGAQLLLAIKRYPIDKGFPKF
jgi:hypothetical protein